MTGPRDGDAVDGGPGTADTAYDACLSASGWFASGPDSPFTSPLDD